MVQSQVQNRWKIYTPHPPPQINDGKMARFGFCAASFLLWGGWGFILSKIVDPIFLSGDLVF